MTLNKRIARALGYLPDNGHEAFERYVCNLVLAVLDVRQPTDFDASDIIRKALLNDFYVEKQRRRERGDDDDDGYDDSEGRDDGDEWLPPRGWTRVSS